MLGDASFAVRLDLPFRVQQKGRCVVRARVLTSRMDNTQIQANGRLSFVHCIDWGWQMWSMSWLPAFHSCGRLVGNLSNFADRDIDPELQLVYPSPPLNSITPNHVTGRECRRWHHATIESVFSRAYKVFTSVSHILEICPPLASHSFDSLTACSPISDSCLALPSFADTDYTTERRGKYRKTFKLLVCTSWSPFHYNNGKRLEV